MKYFDKHKLIITIIFFLLAYLNFFNFIQIGSYGAFGLSFGALLICISTCFEGKFVLYNIDIWNVLKNILYFLGWIFIVVGVYLKKIIFLKD